MVFAPRFQEASDSLIVDNVMAIVKRDFKSALDYYYAADSLPDFAQRTLGEFSTLALPSFAISPKSNAPNQSDDGSWIDETAKVSILLGVESSDAPTATRLAGKYVRALKAVLRSASTADYTAGFPANSIFALNVELEYDYGLIAANAAGWEKIVRVGLTLKFNER